ncbi:E3 ubiquitin-protein ligase RAD18 [Copidosoma floridanum]|uniref:E3 ubiquitin-protein ligase RAD18 n=1 Tax=Copidosoma floridanum TaxID=29053 RepID=UPI0006C9AFD9|nr:E3 ubiquitin-protein ligase RAD18 [Copidosoma floridanum]
MAKVREIPWPEEYQDLKRMEELMICGICYEYMNTSVITPCSHNYCSVCIRKYLHYKTQCPACFHDFFEKDLYINRAMDGLIKHYLQIREKILSLIENRAVYNSVEKLKQEEAPVRPVRSSMLSKSPKPVVERKEIVEEVAPSEPKTPNAVDFPMASTSKSIVSSPTTRSPKVQIPSIAKIFNTAKRKETSAPVMPDASAKTVPCPVCSVNISEHHINVHLDACLGRENNQVTVIKKQPKRLPLPKLVLHVMKETELRKKIKEFGLSTLGDRRALINRFTRYSVIYNAECDKDDPRPVADLIRQCEMEERQERKLDTFLVAKNTDNRLQIERNAQEEKIEEAQKNYRLANKSSFEKLIEEVKNRRKLEKEKKENEQQNQENSEASASEGYENTDYISSADTAFQDLDSDNECPLQLYRSDNTIKSTAVNLDDSSSCTSVPASPVKKQQRIKSRGSAQARKSTAKQSNTETETNNIYEMETDNSSDEMLPSPMIKNIQNRKKGKLLDKFFSKSLSVPTFPVTSNVDDDKVVLLEQDIKETAAKKVCNSIIQDFIFESEEIATGFSETNRKTNCVPNQSKPQEADQKKSQEKVECETVNNQTDSLSNTPPSEGDFYGFSDFSRNNLPSLQTQTIDEKNFSEKENNINGTSQLSANENKILRPARKRITPARYTEKTCTKQTARVINHVGVTNELQEEEYINSQNSTCSEAGSLKRRRGRPRINSSVERSLDETQNPPKKPVRRRQITPDTTLC